jgi:hypothetical protein
MVIEDLDKISIEVRNRLYPESKETYQFGSESSAESGRAVGR